MTVRRWCGLGLGLFALVVAGTQLPVLAQEKDEVKWKAFDYNKDKKEGFYQILKTETNQVMKVQSQELKQEQKQTFYINWIPDEKTDAKGNWVVKQKIIGVKMEIDIGGNKIVYDSIPEAQAQNPLSDFFKKLMTLELTFTIKPDLTVEKIDGRDKFIEELSKVSPQMKALLEKILSEKALIAMADPAWAAFPPGGNLKQKDWTKKSNLDLGPIGIYDTTFTYKHEGKADKNEKIGVTSTLTYSKPTAGAGLPFVIKEGNLKSTDGKGTVEFSREKGRIEKSNMTMKLTGDLTIEVGGMSTKVDLEQNQTASSITQDTNPVEELRKKEKEKK